MTQKDLAVHLKILIKVAGKSDDQLKKDLDPVLDNLLGSDWSTKNPVKPSTPEGPKSDDQKEGQP